MTITRQYITPNCVLVLEGLSDGTGNDSATDSQNPISILVNAECRFMGLDRSIKGGLNFFESLLDAVNNHAQECLSGLNRPQNDKNKNTPRLVSIAKLEDENYHRLTIQPEPDSNGTPVAIDLNSVQMYDLMEVIDQFFSDTNVLPNFSPNLQPLSKRYRHEEEPTAQRAIPISLGIGGLALAAGLMVMMPLPQVRKTEPISPTTPTQSVPNSTKLPTPPTVPNDKNPSPQATPKATTTPETQAQPKATPTPKATTAPETKVTPTTNPTVSPTATPTSKATTAPETKVTPTTSPKPKTKEAKPEKPTVSP
jgi:hypothetical protein